MRAIDADALKQKAFGRRGGLIHTADVDGMPTIEPERKNGKWIKKGAYWFCCSECNGIVPDVRSGGWNYCPNCGIKMERLA